MTRNAWARRPMDKAWRQLLSDAEAAGILQNEWPDLYALLARLLAEGQAPQQVLAVLRECRGLQPLTYACCEGALRHLAAQPATGRAAGAER